MPTEELTDPQLAALRELAAFYRAVLATENQEHPLLSIWDAFEDPLGELRGIITRNGAVFAPASDDENLFEMRDPEELREAGFEQLSTMLQHELSWAESIRSDDGLEVCGFETGQNADRLFSLIARAAQLVAEADDDPAAFPGPLFHEHPDIVFLKG